MNVDAIEVKIYIEGVRLPLKATGSFDVGMSESGPVNGSFVVSAIPGLRAEEWGRARVALFYSDVAIRDEHGDDWPLLFDGEITGHSFSKSPSSRDVVFNMVGNELYWEQCKLFFYAFGSEPNQQGGDSRDVFNISKRKAFFGNKEITVEGGSVGLSIENKILSILKDESKGDGFPSRIRRVFKDALNSNFFFNRSNEQVKLDRRFAVPVDNEVGLLYANTQLLFAQLESKSLAREGDQSIADVLRDALSLLRYKWLSVIQPKLVTGENQYRLRTSGERSEIISTIEAKVFERLGVGLDDLGLTSKSTNAQIQAMARDRTERIESIVNDLGRVGIVDAETMSVMDDPRTSQADVEEVQRQRIGETFLFLVLIRDELMRIDDRATSSDQVRIESEVDEDLKDELAQFLLIPDVSFSLPPLCNVVFPNKSNGYGMTVDHLNEPTRLMSSVPIVDDNIRKVFIAPRHVSKARIPTRTIRHVSSSGTTPPVLNGLNLPRITSKFGFRTPPVSRPDGKTGEFHSGLDFAVSRGTTVGAFDDGVVVHAGPQDPKDVSVGGGRYVSIKHANGTKTQYLHLDSVLVKVSDRVVSGQTIGYSGNTGRSSGPHLHFTYFIGNVKQDPLPMVTQSLNNIVNQANEELLAQNMSIEVAERVFEDDFLDPQSDAEEYQYLTPEEEVLGIVPVYESNTDNVMVSFERDGGEDKTAFDSYMSKVTESRFEMLKYGSRTSPSINIPFSPGFMCGFPVLIVDPVRSILAKAVSAHHNISVVGGSARATTSISIQSPRYWDEGDPYYWIGGEQKFKKGNQLSNVPDESVAHFPSYQASQFVATNSYGKEPTSADNGEPFGGSKRRRPIDEVYRSLFGVGAIPYFYAERTNPATGVTVAYNAAIDGFDSDGKRSSKTIVGHYENLRAEDKSLASNFTRDLTRRIGVLESEYMSFIGASATFDGYDGDAFRPSIRKVIRDYVSILTSNRVFRG